MGLNLDSFVAKVFTEQRQPDELPQEADAPDDDLINDPDQLNNNVSVFLGRGVTLAAKGLTWHWILSGRDSPRFGRKAVFSSRFFSEHKCNMRLGLYSKRIEQRVSTNFACSICGFGMFWIQSVGFACCLCDAF